MRLLKLLTGTVAKVVNMYGGRRAVPRHPKDGTSTLTYGEVSRAAVALHGPGTKVRIWHDGSGHILPPPPYREEENLYGFEHEFQLRRLLPSLGTMTMEEWYAAKGEEPWWLPKPEGSASRKGVAPRIPFAVGDRVRSRPGRCGEDGWPDTGRIAEIRPDGEFAVVRWDGEAVRESWCSVTALEPDPAAGRPFAVGDRVRRADGRPGEGSVTDVWDSGHLIVEWDVSAGELYAGELYGPTGLVPAPGPKASGKPPTLFAIPQFRLLGRTWWP